MFEALQFEFMRNALLAGVLVSIACGIIGSYVVVNRTVFISGGIAHAAYGGIGLGYFLGIEPIWAAIGSGRTCTRTLDLPATPPGACGPCGACEKERLSPAWSASSCENRGWFCAACGAADTWTACWITSFRSPV